MKTQKLAQLAGGMPPIALKINCAVEPPPIRGTLLARALRLGAEDGPPADKMRMETFSTSSSVQTGRALQLDGQELCV